MQLHPTSVCFAASRQSASQVPAIRFDDKDSLQSKRTASLKHCNQEKGNRAHMHHSQVQPAASRQRACTAATCSAALALPPRCALLPTLAWQTFPYTLPPMPHTGASLLSQPQRADQHSCLQVSGFSQGLASFTPSH